MEHAVAWRSVYSELMVNLSAGWIVIILAEAWPINGINFQILLLRVFCVIISLTTAQRLRISQTI